MCVEAKSDCKRIVSQGIEGNRVVWYCEDGTKLRDISNEQYSGPVWNISGDSACPGGYKGIGLFF